MKQPLILLASASPRRSAFLSLLGLPFRALPVNIDESFSGLPMEQEAEKLAERKVLALLGASPDAGRRWILGADTFLQTGASRLGKPKDAGEAEAMLRLLSGSTHRAVTGIALRRPDGRMLAAASVSEVTFEALEARDIAWYLSSGEWEDAAGGYKLQGRGGALIREVKGSPSGVAGLPLHLFYGILAELAYPLRP